MPLIPTTPPQLRLPTSGPRPALRNMYGKMSPSEAEVSLRIATLWPWKTVSG